MTRHPIEAVTVCVGYADFLAEVAPHNRAILDRWVVVTAPADEETRAVCRRFSIECLATEEHGRDGAFSKGRLIDRGLAMLGGADWLLHLDGDVALPADFHQVLADAHLSPECLYGCDRLNVVGAAAWDRVRAAGLLVRTNGWAVTPGRRDTTVGTRVANRGHGYTPIGFFQLWHGDVYNWSGQPDRRYPYHHGTAARTDVQFALQWDRRKRVHIPELLVWHLESEPAAMGANWRGRSTAPFRPGSAPKAAAPAAGTPRSY